ncbi:L,D-transpeptidase family protein [Streptomyces ovatisporus]|uniref:L,D-transpeptidase family protein n=1 Tax=Streptomyces ovatisporus TaxID=1128682 RepID=A0ABV9A5T4_9ACTN
MRGSEVGRERRAAGTPPERTPARVVPAAAVTATTVVLVVALAACGAGSQAGGAGGSGKRDGAGAGTGKASGETGGKRDPTRVPGVGDSLQRRIPQDARQVVAVYGKGEDSAEATVRLYVREGRNWHMDRSWPAHNGRKGWTRAHREGDKRSPVGVFTLTDAGGVLPAPDSKLPYTDSAAFTPPSYWPKKTRHDFDHVIAVDYNRVKGTSPLDPTRPQGQSKGGGIWLHVDHGSGTSGCVSLSKSGMKYLLRTLDPERNPAVVMGDKAALSR